MKNPQQYLCDVCGAAKGDTNHWFIVAKSDFIDLGPRYTGTAPTVLISEWDSAFAETKGVKHACGRACTQKLVERWLETGTLEPARKAAGESL
jgi:hypothetical protein